MNVQGFSIIKSFKNAHWKAIGSLLIRQRPDPGADNDISGGGCIQLCLRFVFGFWLKPGHQFVVSLCVFKDVFLHCEYFVEMGF